MTANQASSPAVVRDIAPSGQDNLARPTVRQITPTLPRWARGPHSSADPLSRESAPFHAPSSEPLTAPSASGVRFFD